MSKRIWLSWMKQLGATLFIVYVATAAYDGTDATSGSSDNPLIVGLWGPAIYLALSLVISLVNGAGGLLYAWLDKGSDFEALALEDFRRLKLPPPREWHPRRLDYLLMLADDSTENTEDRIKAAALYGSYSMAKQHLPFIRSIAFAGAVDRAVLRYSQEAPKTTRA